MVAITEIALAITENMIANLGSTFIDRTRLQMKSKRLAERIKENCMDPFRLKYGNEIYYSKMDNYLEGDKYINQIIGYFFNKNLDMSLNSLANEEAERVVCTYPDLYMYLPNIMKAIRELSYNVVQFLDKEDSIEDYDKIVYRLNENYNHHEESIKELSLQLGSLTQIMQTINIVKTDNRAAMSNYKELSSVYRNKSLSRFEKEIQIYEWINKNSDLKEALVSLAYIYEEDGDLEHALDLFRYVADKYEDEYILYNNVGCILMTMERLSEAKEALEKVINRPESSFRELYNLAVVEYLTSLENDQHVSESSLKLSMEYIDKAYQINSEDVEVMNFKAFLYMITRKDFDLALELFNKCIEKDEEICYKINRITCLFLRRKFDEAITEAEQLISGNNDPDLYSFLGNLYATVGVENKEKAVEMLNKAYVISGQEQLRPLIDAVSNGFFIDSICLNGAFVEIYTEEELIRMRENI